MIVNLDNLKEHYRKDMIDTDSYGVHIEMEAFALIWELLAAFRETQEDVVRLREEVNALTAGEPPYPYPAYDVLGESFYITSLIRNLYECIFEESPDE